MDAQSLFNILILFSTGFCSFLFFRSIAHGERIQRLEDITGNEVKELKEDFKSFKKEITDKLDKAMSSIKDMGVQIHKEKNVEQQMQATLSSLLKFMEEHHSNHEKHN